MAGCGSDAAPAAQPEAPPTEPAVKCDAGKVAGQLGDCLPAGAVELFHEFGTQTTQPGEEVTGRCRSWTLNNETDLFVNSVHFVQNEGSHHANFEFVPDRAFDGPDGFWNCADRSYDFYVATAQGGVLFAQSTQATDETQAFPEGAAIRIPAHSRVLSDVHLLNTTDQVIEGRVRLSVVTLPPEQVTTDLYPFHIEYGDLHIAPQTTTRFTATCDLATTVSAATGSPFAPQLFFTKPHTHKWGRRVFMNVLGGPLDGQKIFSVGAYNGEGHGMTYDPPLDLTGAQGFTYGCEYTNSGDTELTWGFADGEMCEIFGFVSGEPFFWASVYQGHDMGMDGTTVLQGGDCIPTVMGTLP